MPRRTILLAAFGPMLLLAGTAATTAQEAEAGTAIPSPDSFFLRPIGSDYFLADYTQYEAYLRQLAATSDRMRLVDFGKSEEGRTMWMAVVSSPANLARIDEYRAMAEQLARGRVSEAEAQRLSREGKAIVWIDAGLHATETVTSQGQIQVLHRMLTADDPETLRILDDCIVLFAHDNPDGMELVSDWYMRHADPQKREFATLPRLYHKYAGHDNNRDSYMSQLAETRSINQVLFRRWYPQIVYNQHQTGPDGMVVFIPPFRDPFNFNYDPLVMAGLSEVGHAMQSRLIEEGKPGGGTRSVASYSTWNNGMVRSINYFHNAIGLLTEIIGGPTPTTVPLVPDTQMPRNDEPLPIAPRPWHLQDTLDYQHSLNRAVLDYASRNRERLLMNIWRMGANSIARGSRDSWTMDPVAVERMQAAAPLRPSEEERAWRGPKRIDPALYQTLAQDPAERDPRAYILSTEQHDLPTTVTFVNALISNGVEVERAAGPITVGDRQYPAGSFVIRTAQAYRPFVLDMFEPQHHPHDTQYPGGPPKAPYDITGYTLAYQMGVGFDRVLDGLDAATIAALAPVADVIAPPPGGITGAGDAGWLVGHETNNSFILTNRLLKAGVPVSWLEGATSADGATLQPGAIWIPAGNAARRIVADSVGPLGLTAHALPVAPTGPAIALRPVRIGLVDQWGGLMPAGWTRWLLEQFEFDFAQVFPQRLDAGDLDRDFDILVFTDDTLPAGGAWGGGRAPRQPAAADTPRELRPMLGAITDARTVPAVARFVRDGGAIVAVGSAARFADLLDTPLSAALARQVDGVERPLETSEFYIPGSILRARVDNTQPLGFGLPAEVDMFFRNAQTFVPTSDASGIRPVSWFEGRNLLRSGWAVGEEKLAGTIAVADVPVGRGRLLLMGPEVTQRAQPYGTFKFLFNALLWGGAERD